MNNSGTAWPERAMGLIDLLKTIDSRQRSSRFKDKGLINQPGFKQAAKADQYGLWIDEAEVPEAGGNRSQGLRAALWNHGLQDF